MSHRPMVNGCEPRIRNPLLRVSRIVAVLIRLNSAVGYITPKDVLAGRQAEIHAERDRKVEEARKQRQIRRRQAAWKRPGR